MKLHLQWARPLGRFASADSIVAPGAARVRPVAYANNSPVNYTDPTGHFGKHNDDKSDYWNKQNEEKVKQLEGKWEKEKAEKGLAQLVQATGKELALDPSLGVSAAFGGGKPSFGPTKPPDYSKWFVEGTDDDRRCADDGAGSHSCWQCPGRESPPRK